ncbi:hypothetical protein EFM98_01435 [Propionibacterium freudenreichii]|nr:hypothetical protein [Propionibacterium freudenreichii]SBM44174.1 Hypothetical protein PFR_JS2_2015 [Propionibacterium freudenreichii]
MTATQPVTGMSAIRRSGATCQRSTPEASSPRARLSALGMLVSTAAVIFAWKQTFRQANPVQTVTNFLGASLTIFGIGMALYFMSSLRARIRLARVLYSVLLVATGLAGGTLLTLGAAAPGVDVLRAYLGTITVPGAVCLASAFITAVYLRRDLRTRQATAAPGSPDTAG